VTKHYVGKARSHDTRRDAFLTSLGIRVLRIMNDDVYENLEGVWEAIARAAREQMERLGPTVPRGRRPKRKRE
jgi:very-short-patch-repair endonuclease